MEQESTGASPRNWPILAAGLALTIAGAILLSPVAGAWGDKAAPPLPAAAAAQPVAARGEAAEPAALEAGQADEALAIAQADPTLRALLAGKTVETQVVPWTTLDEEPLGAGLDITWAGPVRASGTWPTALYDETETLSPPYVATTAAVDVSELTGVHVLIDLASGTVVSIDPLPGADVKTFKLRPGSKSKLPPQPEDKQ